MKLEKKDNTFYEFPSELAAKSFVKITSTRQFVTDKQLLLKYSENVVSVVTESEKIRKWVRAEIFGFIRGWNACSEQWKLYNP